MALANMICTDEDALVCDMAETYGVFDLFSLPAPLAATLAIGLRDNSRIKQKLLGMDMPLDDYLLAAIFDSINWLCWTKTKDASRGINQPKRIVEILTRKEEKKEKDNDFLVFNTAEEFERERARLLRGNQDG